MKKVIKKREKFFLFFVRGFHFYNNSDSLGQNYVTPSEAIIQGADCIIVGRGIYEADDPAKELSVYKEGAWRAFTSLEE